MKDGCTLNERMMRKGPVESKQTNGTTKAGQGFVH